MTNKYLMIVVGGMTLEIKWKNIICDEMFLDYYINYSETHLFWL